MIIAVLDSVADVTAAVGPNPGPLTRQELRELDRTEQIRRYNKVNTKYVVCVDAGVLSGFLPIYPSPSWFLPTRRVSGLFEMESGDWSRMVLLGSDTSTPNYIHMAHDNRAALIEAALSVVDSYDAEIVCAPLLDDTRHAMLAPLLPDDLTGEREEAYFDLPFDSFADYVMALPKRWRRRVRKERRFFLSSGLTLHSIHPAQAADLWPLLYQVGRKYDAPITPLAQQTYLETTAMAMHESGRALVVAEATRPIAIALLWDVGTHWRVRTWGCDYANPVIRAASVYFNLVFYEPITRAIEAGVSRVVVGTGSLGCKRQRGARTRTLRSIGWERTVRSA